MALKIDLPNRLAEDERLHGPGFRGLTAGRIGSAMLHYLELGAHQRVECRARFVGEFGPAPGPRSTATLTMDVGSVLINRFDRQLGIRPHRRWARSLRSLHIAVAIHRLMHDRKEAIAARENFSRWLRSDPAFREAIEQIYTQAGEAVPQIPEILLGPG